MIRLAYLRVHFFGGKSCDHKYAGLTFVDLPPSQCCIGPAILQEVTKVAHDLGEQHPNGWDDVADAAEVAVSSFYHHCFNEGGSYEMD